MYTIVVRSLLKWLNGDFWLLKWLSWPLKWPTLKRPNTTPDKSMHKWNLVLAKFSLTPRDSFWNPVKKNQLCYPNKLNIIDWMTPLKFLFGVILRKYGPHTQRPISSKSNQKPKTCLRALKPKWKVPLEKNQHSEFDETIEIGIWVH